MVARSKADRDECQAAGEVVNLPAGLLTPTQAAVVLAISPRKLWGLTASFEIPHVRIGRCVRYRPAELDGWINSMTIAAKARRA